MATVTATKAMLTPTVAHQQQQQGQRIRAVPGSSEGMSYRNSNSNRKGDGDCKDNLSRPNISTGKTNCFYRYNILY
jgi:hypothetical protein